MSTSADPRQAERVAELYRQVRAITDRVRPLHDSYKQLKDSGNEGKADVLWNAMSAEEREEVAHYPQFVAALETLRQGRLPSASEMPPSVQRLQHQGAVGAAPKVGATVTNRTQQSHKRRRRGGPGRANGRLPRDEAETSPQRSASRDTAASSASGSSAGADEGHTQAQEPETDESEEPEAITVDVTTLKTAEDAAEGLFSLYTADARERLLVLFVAQHMATSSQATRDLAAAEAKLEEVVNTKKRIVSGALKKPSKAQMSDVERIPAFRKEVNHARKRVDREEVQLRARVIELLEAMEASSSAAEEEASQEDEEKEGSHSGSVTALSEHGAPQAAAQSTAAGADEVTASHRAPTPTGDDTLPAALEDDKTPVEQRPDSRTDAGEARELEMPPRERSTEEEEGEEQSERAAHAAADGLKEAEEATTHSEGEEAGEVAPPAEVTRTPPPPVSSAITGFTEGNEWHKLVYHADGFTMNTFRSLVRHPEKTSDGGDEIHGAAARDVPPAEEEKVDDEETVAAAPPLPTHAEDKQLHYVRHHIDARTALEEEATSAVSSEDTTDADSTADVSSNPSKDRNGEGETKPFPTVTPPPTHGTNGEQRTSEALEQCLAREWAALEAAPVPRVCVRRAGATVWHVCVSPLDGPFAGFPLHVSLRFAASYPFTAPRAKLDVAVPHPALMVSTTGEANALFLTYPTETGAGPWRPDFSARTALCALQDLFNAKGFDSMRAALGEAAFDAQVRVARLGLTRAVSTCPCCATGARAEYVNGPLLTRDGTGGGDDEGTAGDRVGARLSCEAATGGWLPAGPWRQCFAHLLVTRTETDPDSAIRLRVRSRGLPLAKLTDGVVRLCEVTRASAWSATGAGSETPSDAPTAVADWAAALLVRRDEASTASDATSPTPLFRWSASASAWHDVSRESTSTSMEAGRGERKEASGCGERVAELTVDCVPEGAGTCATTDSESTDAVHVVLPTSRGREGGAERLFAVVFDSMEGQSLSFQVSQGPVAPAFHSLEDAVSASSPPFSTTWPATAFYLDPTTAGANTAEDPLMTTTGVLVELPYLQHPSASAAGPAASYYIPRTTRFHLDGARVPLILPESVYLNHRCLLLTRRRRRDGTYPPIEDGAPRDDYLTSATEDVLRRALDLDDAGTASSSRGAKRESPTEVSKYFWGLRTVFIPFTRSWGRDDFGRTHSLDRLKRTAIQAYRHPGASVAYHPPFRPLQLLHLLSLVLRSVLPQPQSPHDAMITTTTTADTADGDMHSALYVRLCEEIERTTLDLAADSPAFLNLCVDVVDRHVRTAEEMGSATPAAEGCERLFPRRPPFVPLSASSTSSSTTATAASDTASTADAATTLADTAARLGEPDVAHYLAHEDTLEGIALFVAATVVVRSAMAPPTVAGGMAQAEQERLLTRTQAKAAYLRNTVAEAASREDSHTPPVDNLYTYVGAVPDAACARALATLLARRGTDE